MRTYNETHPWITFQADLRQASYEMWLHLGEAQAMCKDIADVPLLPAVANKLLQIYFAKGVLATTAIEGNTLTEEEVLQRLEGHLKLPPSKEYLGQEIDNIIEACNLIAERILSGNPAELRAEDFCEYNSLVLKNLPLGEDVIPGNIRRHNVLVGRYRGAPVDDCQFLTEKLCGWLNSEFKPLKGYEIAFGILKAIIAHIYIAWIHPFADGNGRTARLIELQILLSVGIPATAAHLLSNHYNLTRTEYYRQLNMSSKSGGNLLPFIDYALRGFIDGLQEQIDLIKTQQLHVHWIYYVHDSFRNKDSSADVRRRHLIIDLTSQKDPVPVSKVRHISPRIAEEYANKTDKTVKRDLNDLEKMRLIRKTSNGVVANRDIIRAFIPPTRLE
jgi:Fic family protein